MSADWACKRVRILSMSFSICCIRATRPWRQMMETSPPNSWFHTLILEACFSFMNNLLVFQFLHFSPPVPVSPCPDTCPVAPPWRLESAGPRILVACESYRSGEKTTTAEEVWSYREHIRSKIIQVMMCIKSTALNATLNIVAFILFTYILSQWQTVNPFGQVL